MPANHLSPSSSTTPAPSTNLPLLNLNPSSSPSNHQVRVLVADDQPLTRMVIKSMVSKAFPQVAIDMAENGELAVAKAETIWYDLILMGIILLLWDSCEVIAVRVR